MKGLRNAGWAIFGMAALVVMTAQEASAQGASDEEGVLMKDMLSKMGIIGGDRPSIDYRERAPLVVPPNMELRPPGDPASVEKRAANWPKDPDVMAERKRQADANVPRTETDLYKRNTNQTRLSNDELRAGRVAGAAVPDRPEVDPKAQLRGPLRRSGWMSPDDLRALGRQQPQQAAAPGQRRALTDPPAALRGPAPGAPVQATQDPIQHEDEANPYSFIRQQNSR